MSRKKNRGAIRRKRIARDKQKPLLKEAAELKEQLEQLGHETINILNQYEIYQKLPQFKSIIGDVHEWFVNEAKAYLEKDLKFVAKMTAKGWNTKDAQALHDLVVTETFSVFRQKFKPPSDFYGLLLEEYSAEEIELAMMEMNATQYDIRPDAISALIDILDAGVL